MPRTVTANQMVAYNLRKARELKGWKQEEAAQKLEPFLGRRWSKAVWSAAERSYETDRVRQFSAEEIEAFGRCFELPIGWFFLPPVDEDPEVHVGEAGAHAKPVNAGEQLDIVYPFDQIVDEGVRHLIARVAAMFADPASRGSIPRRYRTAPQLAAAEGLMQILVASLQAKFGDLQQKADSLREVADLLEEGLRGFGGSGARPKRRAKQKAPGRKQ